MIEYALLVMLGFCTAGLLALLIAPTIWRRAVRLTTKRLDATLPMSLSDIEADKDLLRASYAMQIRRLEAGLNKARDKSAGQLVEISRLQIVVGEFRDRVAALEKQLEERSNAAHVFERTIRKRFPELEAALVAAKAALDERATEVASLQNAIRRREEALSLIQRSSALQQGEIQKLREGLEGNSVDRTGRFKKSPAQWTLQEFRSEHDRLNLELSKVREQLALAQEREAGQVAVLRTELQNLAEQIMAAAAAQERQIAAQRASDNAALSPPREETPPRPARRPPAERPMSAPQPWPRTADRSSPAAGADRSEAADVTAETATRRPDTAGQPNVVRPPVRPPEARRPSITSEAASDGAKGQTAALRTLLNRNVVTAAGGPEARLSVAGKAEVRTPATPDAAATQASEVKSGTRFDSAAAIPTNPALRAKSSGDEAPSAEPSAAGTSAEPNIDRMLREIFDGRGTASSSAAGDLTQADAPLQSVVASAAPSGPENGSNADDAEEVATSEKKQSLLERLRVV